MKSEPTPKRKDAEAARKKALKVPKDSKEAKKAVRQRAREQRVETRLAMNRGEEWAMPYRDKGPAIRNKQFEQLLDLGSMIKLKLLRLMVGIIHQNANENQQGFSHVF